MFSTLPLCPPVFPAAFRAAIAGELYNQKTADLIGIYLSQVRPQRIRAAVRQAESLDYKEERGETTKTFLCTD